MLLNRTQAPSSINRKYPLEIYGTYFCILFIHPHKIPEDCTILFYHASQQFIQLSAEVNLVPHPSYTAQKVFLPFNFYII